MPAAQTEEGLKQAEPFLRGVYENRSLRGAKFELEWERDSSGFTTSDGTIRHDVSSGEQTELIPDDDEKQPEWPSPKLKEGEYIISHSKSPDGSKWLFVKGDDAQVKVRLTLNSEDPSYPTVEETKFARVGGTIPSHQVGIADAEGKNIKWIPIPEAKEGFYLDLVNWANNSDEVVIEWLSRFRDQRDIYLYDTKSDELTKIYHEIDPAWVVCSKRRNNGLEWLMDGQSFLVISEKDGWRHAYTYNRDGSEEVLITNGDYDIIEKVKIDELGGWFYFLASPKNATQQYLYKVALDGSSEKPVRVTPEGKEGTHDYEFSPDGKYAVHTYSNFGTPPVIELVEFPEHRAIRTLEDNAELIANLAEFPQQETELVELDIGDGIKLDASIMRPSHFDSSKKYPVLVYVYGEPHLQTVLDQWACGQSMFHRPIAELGYIVVSIDNRGTPGPKGSAWRRSVFGSLGPLSTREQAAGLRALGRMKSYVDLDRVAIWGWSGGGSNTLNAMFREPDLYDVGIAVVAKPQPHLYFASFQEIYMNTPEVNPDGYKDSAPLNFAEGLKGDLLIIHGSGETNTHIQIVEGLVDRLIELGKPFDYMVYPNRDHGLSEGPGSTYHVRMSIVRYLLKNLPRGGR